MTLSAKVPVEHLGAANAELEAAGFGPNNFSVPVRSGSGGATHASFHHWKTDDAFAIAVKALSYPGLVYRQDTGGEGELPAYQVNFQAFCDDEGLDWSDPNDPENPWFENPVMIDDEREHGGKTWRSLIDNNVWEPPYGWREVVSEGYPEWVQPSGAHDAYALGDRVSYNGSDWESTTPANVWAPGIFGWTQL